MSLDDQRYYEILYGFYPVYWSINFGTFAAHHYILDTAYIDIGCDTVDSSIANVTHRFIYPQYTKKIYFVEGTIKGQLVFEAVGGATVLTSYRVTLCKMGIDGTISDIATTGTITVGKTLAYTGAPYYIGDAVVLPFWIDCSVEKKVEDEERLFLEIEAVCSNNFCHLLHGNDPSHIDLKVEIPIRG